MELKDIVEHKAISLYNKNFLWAVENPKERLEKLVNLYKGNSLSLDKLKLIRDNVKISDNNFFQRSYFPLLEFLIRDVEGFAKIIIGSDVKQTLIEQCEIEEEIESVSEYGRATFQNKQVFYNGFASNLGSNPKLKQKDIEKLIKERKLFLFGETVEKVVEKQADIKYDFNNKNNIFILEESPLHGDGLEFKHNDVEFFNKYYKDVLKIMRHSLSDESIENAKNNMRKNEFGLIENEFEQAINYYSDKVESFKELKEQAVLIKNGKNLVKKPN